MKEEVRVLAGSLRMRRADGGARESIVVRGGVVGYEIPPLRPITYAVAAGDTLVMATDGIRGIFGDQLRAEASPRELADQILREHGKRNEVEPGVGAERRRRGRVIQRTERSGCEREPAPPPEAHPRHEGPVVGDQRRAPCRLDERERGSAERRQRSRP